MNQCICELDLAVLLKKRRYFSLLRIHLSRSIFTTFYSYVKKLIMYKPKNVKQILQINQERIHDI